eukprot:9481193-Pyramimonas_sp.AAC.1
MVFYMGPGEWGRVLVRHAAPPRAAGSLALGAGRCCFARARARRRRPARPRSSRRAWSSTSTATSGCR